MEGIVMNDTKQEPTSAEYQAPTLELARPSGDTEENRTCMACGQPFLSEGWHNRLCARCRKRSEMDGW